ncbi:MAG: DUF362 domain-containing protein [Desulfobacterales bacterium]|jgi:uncharacterized protein (DUF362 family)|nr:DUF362 domain-containing protein [Desulfobacterales bacterium]
MNLESNQNIVFIKQCEEYDRERLGQIIAQGMNRFNFKPRGKVMIKPNVVFAYQTDRFGKMAYTPPPFVGASLVALSKSPGLKRIDVGENCAVGFPTRLCYKSAGYYDEIKIARKQAKCKVGIFCMDEEPRESVFIGGVVHDNLRISKKMARADAKVYLPKLKCHCVSKMTGAVKLNIGICSDDERSIRHDFMLNEKIVDLLSAGYPDFIIMDAIDVGMGNEAFPTPRKLGLVIMGTNPLAVDIVGARLLGLSASEVPYLKVAMDRGYTPASIDQIDIDGDLKSVEDIDEQAKRLMPYDDEFYRWQDVEKELKRMNSPMRFYWGPYRKSQSDKCLTGCVMGLKMFLGGFEKFAGVQAFATARPVSFVIGRYEEPIDANGEEVYLLGSCAKASISNAKKVVHIDKCFTTATDMNLSIGHKLGMPAPTRDPKFLMDLIGAASAAMGRKMISMRYFQDIGHFLSKGLIRRI